MILYPSAINNNRPKLTGLQNIYAISGISADFPTDSVLEPLAELGIALHFQLTHPNQV